MTSIPSIVVEQSFGSLGIEITPAQMKIVTPRLEMEVTREDPELSIDYERPEFKVNWKKVRSESGLKPPSDFADSNIQTAQKHYSKNISETVNDGNYVAKTQIPGRRLAHLARQKTIKAENVEINLGTIPKSMPEVEWTPGVINVNWTRGSLNINWVGEYMPQVIIDPPFSIDIYLREKPYIKVMVEDGTVPTSATGSVIDLSL